MLVDYLNIYLGETLRWPAWVGFLGRFVAPAFSFLLVEGYFHTRSRRRYLARLLLGALITGRGNIVYNLLTKAYINPVTHQPDYFLFLGPHNIFLTLAMQLIMMWALDQLLNKQRLLLTVPVFIASMFFMAAFEGGVYLLPLALIFFIGRRYDLKGPMLLVTAGWCLLLFLKAWLNYHGGMTSDSSFYRYLTFDNEFMMILVVPLIWLYNGQRGGNGIKFERNFFYYFYPLHLWIIYITKALV